MQGDSAKPAHGLAEPAGRLTAYTNVLLASMSRASVRGKARSDYYASHDGLTDLRNRRHLMLALARAIARARVDPGYGFALVTVDLAGFRTINERFDYDHGDLVLRAVARRLVYCTRESDTLARTGGNEFTVLIESNKARAAPVAISVARRIETAFRRPIRVRDVKLKVRASIGVAVWAERYREGSVLLRNADTAMRMSRSDPNLRYLVFTDTMHEEEAAANALESELRSAIERKEFRVYYQPLIDVAAARVYGFEALVRWFHPERGLMSPTDFIPLAESTGLIVPIGTWVLQQATLKAREWHDLTGTPLLMSVNVSGRQLQDESFSEVLQEALGASHVDPSCVQLEITESVFMSGGMVESEILRHARELGVRVALDDFGTGYSSLSYLERNQIDALKIDQSFIARIDDASASSEIVRMIVALAQALGLRVIAEGVETAAQGAALVALGCTHFQGFFYSRPLPEDEISGYLRTRWPQESQVARLLYGPSAQGGPELSVVERHELREHVTEALERHLLWKGDLDVAIETGEPAFPSEMLAREDLCPVGIWLSRSISEELKHTPLYAVTMARHAVFHRGASRLLALALARDASARPAFERGAFATVAETLDDALGEWLAVSGDAPER